MKRTPFVVKYNDNIAGLYKPGQELGIGSDDHRSLVADISDSVMWPEDFFEVAAMTAVPLPDSTYDDGDETITGDEDGALTVDGIALADGDHVIINDQADETQNGLYLVTEAGGVADPFILTRVALKTFNPPYYVAGGTAHEGWTVCAGGTGSSVEPAISEEIEATGTIPASSGAPITLVIAPGANKAIACIYFVASMDFDTDPYNDTVFLQLFVGSNSLVGEVSGFLDQMENKTIMYSVPAQDIEINQPLTAMLTGGDPASGNSPVTITAKYRIITI